MQELKKLLEESYRRNKSNRLERMAMSIYFISDLLESKDEIISISTLEFRDCINDVAGFKVINSGSFSNIIKVCISKLDGLLQYKTGQLMIHVSKIKELTFDEFISKIVTKTPRKQKEVTLSKKELPNEKLPNDYAIFEQVLLNLIGNLCVIQTKYNRKFELSVDVDRKAIHLDI